MTHKTLSSYIGSLSEGSPLLQKCSDKDVQEFLSSLLFRNGGLAHAEYGMIENKLSEDEFFELWADLGIDKPTFLAQKDTHCPEVGKGCKPKDSSLCNSRYCG